MTDRIMLNGVSPACMQKYRRVKTEVKKQGISIEALAAGLFEEALDNYIASRDPQKYMKYLR